MGKNKRHEHHHESLIERAERKLTRKGWRVVKKEKRL